MIKTIVVIKKGKVYSDKIFNFIDNVFSKRIPAEERQTLELIEGKDLDSFRNYLKTTFNLTSRFIEDRGHGTSVFKGYDAFIIQIKEVHTNVFTREESEITDDLITGNGIVAGFIDKLYPVVVSTPTPETPTPTTTADANDDKSKYLLYGAAAQLLILLFKK